MAHTYSYFYVGNLDLTAEEMYLSPPRLLTFSKIRHGQKDEISAHAHAFLEMFYFERGNGFFEHGGKTYPIKANDFLVVDARQRHMQYSTDCENPLTYYCFAVDNLNLSRRSLNCLSGNGFFLHSFGNRRNGIYRNILLLLDELRGKRYCYASKVAAIFSEVIIDAVRLCPDYEQGEVQEFQPIGRLLTAVKDYIDEHYAEEICLTDLTRVSFMNKSYLLHRFKRQFGISPMRYLTLVRIEKGKLLLASSDRSITEIASDVGIDNPVYFTEIFSRTVGFSPTAYRKIVFAGS